MNWSVLPPNYNEGVSMTPHEMQTWLVQLNEAERTQVVASLMESAFRGANCVACDHPGYIEHMQRAMLDRNNKINELSGRVTELEIIKGFEDHLRDQEEPHG